MTTLAQAIVDGLEATNRFLEGAAKAVAEVQVAHGLTPAPLVPTPVVEDSTAAVRVAATEDCSNCLYFLRRAIPSKTDYGFCRRYPPTFAVDPENDYQYQFPICHKTDWCGEYKKQ